MMLRKIGLSLFVATSGLVAGMPAHADLNISDHPLFLITPVTPAVILAMDSSASMDFEIIIGGNDGAMWWHADDESFTGWGVNADATQDVREAGRVNFNNNGNAVGDWRKYVYLFPNGFGDDYQRETWDDDRATLAIPPLPEYAYARSPAFNSIYFNPAETYVPFPSMGNQIFSDADPEQAFWNVTESNLAHWVNLTVNIEETDDNWVFRMYRGMTVPDGTRVKRAQSNRCQNAALKTPDWEVTTSDENVNVNQVDGCSLAISYFPATFWLPDGETPPASFGFDEAEKISGGKTPDGQEMFGYEIKPENFASAAHYQAAINNFANWFQYYRKRTLLTKAAIGRAFEGVDFLRVGYFTIHNRQRVDMKDLNNAAEQGEFYDWVYGFRGNNGGTPNRRGVDHMGEQFEREIKIADPNPPVLEACQRNYGLLVTDGFSDPVGPNVGNEDRDLDSPLGDNESHTMADIAYKYYNDMEFDLPAGLVPTPSACSGASPPLDLDCQDDPHMNLFAITLGGQGLIFGQDQDKTDDPLNNMTSADWPTNFPDRHPGAIDDLWHATLNTRGAMFSATNPTEMVDALRGVIDIFETRNQPVGVVAAATRLDQDSLYYQATLDSTTWSGDLTARKISDQSEEWSAREEMPNPANRNIVMLNAAGDGLVDFETSMSAVERAQIFGSVNPPPQLEQDQVIDYLRGIREFEEQHGGSFRDRDGDGLSDGVLADIANARPGYSGLGNAGWGRLDADYLDYVDINKPARTPLVLIGANGGMLHAFDAENGDEVFAYVPGAVKPNLPNLSDPDYTHLFYVDGQVAVGDIKINDVWKTVAVGGFGGGARGAYALDITTPNDPKLLWELSSDDYPDLGHVFGEPIISRLGDGSWVAIFGNGYNSDDDDAILFVVPLEENPLSTEVQQITLDDSASVNGLSGAAVFLDQVSRLYVARVYAGDLKGNMWRVDFDEDGNHSMPFTGDDPLMTVSDELPITAAPSLAASPAGGLMVYFGSGKLLENSDRVATANNDYEQFWAVRDANQNVTPDQLGVASMSLNLDGNRVITAASGASNGFRLELGTNVMSGERVLARPQVIFGRLLFTTYEPVEDPCAPGGIPRIYILNALSGRGFLSQLCPGCGVLELDPGAPVDPSFVLNPPSSPEYANGEPDLTDPTTVPGAGSVGSRNDWCTELLILTPAGFISGGSLCDGRQGWMERNPGT